MTYCLGMLLDEGLIMIADSRTNAGVDDFSTFKKLHTLCEGPDRQIYAATAGSLSISQSVIGLIQEGIPAAHDSQMNRSLNEVSSMFRAAQLVGEAVQLANRTVGAALAAINMSQSASILLGGRVGDGAPALFLIYGAGNFIECKAESPFLQIGETKYGKPILDRNIKTSMPLAEAVKIGFLSFDGAIKSNLGVDRPLDMMVMTAEPGFIITRRIEKDDVYFNGVSDRWANMLHDAVRAIPNPPFM